MSTSKYSNTLEGFSEIEFQLGKLIFVNTKNNLAKWSKEHSPEMYKKINKKSSFYDLPDCTKACYMLIARYILRIV